MKISINNASIVKIALLLFVLIIFAILFLVGCKSKPQNNDYKSWKSAELQKLEYDLVYDINGDDLKEINDYLISATVSDINIEDTNKYLYRIHIEIEIDDKITDQNWEIYEIDGKSYLKDHEGNISESESEFIEFLNQLYTK